MAAPVFAPARIADLTAASPSDALPAAEARRRFAVRLVFLIYGLSLVEGPLRKWFLPELATPLYFLRDPFVYGLYAYCLHHRLFAWGTLGRIWLVFALAASLIGLLPFALQGLDVRGWILGVRTYWLYMPLAFAVAGTFRRDDIIRFLRFNLLLAVPYAALIATQYGAGRDAWINRGVAGDTEMVVGVSDGIVRPFGLFTYTGPNVDFTAAMIGFFLAYYLSGDRSRWRTLLLWGGAVAVASMAVLTGSRSIYFLASAILLTTLVGSTVADPSARTMARNLGIFAFVALGAVLLIYAYGDMLAAMQDRFARAAASEGSIWTRAFGGVAAFVEPLWTAPFFGGGIGTGTPAISRFLGLPPLLHGEGELARVVNELGPILGLAFVALRFGTAITLGVWSMTVARSRISSALPLAGYAMIPIAIGQITHSPINGFMPWLTVGLVRALVSTSDDGDGRRPVRPTRFTPTGPAGTERGERP